MKTWLLVGAIAAILAFAYWAISPLFITIHVDDALPSESLATPKTDEKKATIPEEKPITQNTPVEVVGTIGHPAEGTARVVKADDKTYVRYENFKTINGPDLFVYLAKDTDASEFVNLGTLKATEGNVNYEVPAGVNIEEYPYVLTWCRAFSVLFNYAKLH